MGTLDFFILLNEGNNYLLFTGIFICSLIIVIKLANHVSNSWLNPLNISILTLSITITVIIFLYVTKSIRLFPFVYVSSSIIIYWTTFCKIYKKKQRIIHTSLKNELFLTNRLFYITYILYIFLTLFSYWRFGIPIFNENSRLATYTNSGGFGIIQRFQVFLFTYSVFYLIARFLSQRISLIRLIILLIPFIIIGILSGSRSSFKNYIFIFWAVKYFYLGINPKISNYKWLIISFICVGIITFFIQTGNLRSALFGFYERTIAAGDLYWMSLPNEVWDKVQIHEPIKYILNGLLTPLRIMSGYNETAIGFQLFNIVVGLDKLSGPVACYPVASYILFGTIGGLFFSFLQAYICAHLLKLFYVRSNSLLICAFSYYCYNMSLSFLSDAAYAMGNIANIIFNVCLLFAIFVIIGFYKNYPVYYQSSLLKKKYRNK